MISDDQVTYTGEHAFRALGICWVMYGIFRIAEAIWLVSFSTTATVMFGALLNRVSDPFGMMSAFHAVYTFVIVFGVICGALGIFAGVALLSAAHAGRVLTVIAAILCLSNLPLGLTLGAYSLIVLLPMRGLHISPSMSSVHGPALRDRTHAI